ncbi:TPA: hypothetical protein ACGWER_001750 [Streptococcus agalactiae]|nr:hypothetical protein [Streptococcus agalactiae]HEO2267398.1 hypothetical protein [Streptococcus agalactiae]
MKTNADRTRDNILTVLSWIKKKYFTATFISKKTSVSKYTLYSLTNDDQNNTSYADLDLNNLTLKTAKNLCKFYEENKKKVKDLENGTR